MSELARGVYRYWRDGQLQAITEPWRLLAAPAGLLLRGKRLVDGLPFLDLEADYVGARCTGLRLHWQPPAPEALRSVEYQLRDDGLLRWRFEQEVDFRELALATDALLFPLLRAGTGLLLGTLTTGARNVVLPCIRNAADAASFLHPITSQRHVSVPVLAGDQSPTLRYHGGEYGVEGCDCWLDDHGLLQRYHWHSPQGVWDVRLEELHCAETFRGFVG